MLVIQARTHFAKSVPSTSGERAGPFESMLKASVVRVASIRDFAMRIRADFPSPLYARTIWIGRASSQKRSTSEREYA